MKSTLPEYQRSSQSRPLWPLLLCGILLYGTYLKYDLLFTSQHAYYKHEIEAYTRGLQECASIRQSIDAEISATRSNPRFKKGTLPTLIKNASLINGDGTISYHTSIMMENGVFAEVDANFELSSRKEVKVYDVQGRFVTPGIVDMHSHAGVDAYPEFWGNEDTNEISGPVTSQMRTIDAIHVEDVMIKRIMSGGITTSLILPGSANLIGGEAFVIKHAEQKSKLVEDYLLQAGVDGKRQRWIKMACGENPKRVYPKQTNTRMGEAWGFRHRFDQARTLMRQQDAWCAKASSGPDAVRGQDFPSDLELESMVGVLRGDVQINNHCYTTVDFEMQIRNSEEFGFQIGAFHHALEAWKVPELLKKAGNITVATFANLWGYKAEAFNGSPWAGKILTDAGVPLTYKSDHPVTNSQHLVYQSQIATHFDLSDHFAIKAITSVPAESLGLGHRIGYVRAGYDADLVVWNQYPLDLGAFPQQVWIDGEAQIDPEQEWSSLSKHKDVSQVEIDLADCQESVTDFVIRGISNNYHSDQDGDVLVMQNGKISCLGTSQSCHNEITALTTGAPTFDIHGASIVPGITTTAPGLGLVEIDAESSTKDGKVDESNPLDAKTLINAIDGLVFGGPHIERAARMGVTTAIVAPQGNFRLGISTAFDMSASSILDHEAIVKKQVSIDFVVGDEAKGDKGAGSSSISTQIKTIRTIVESGEGIYGSLKNGTLPLVIEVHDSDAIGHLILMKRQYSDLDLVIKGATEAFKVAKELKEADIPVLLYPRCMPATWRTRDCLPGPPLSSSTGLSILLKEGVKVGLIGNDDGNLGEGYWEAEWAAKLAQQDGIYLTSQETFDLVSKNVRNILKLPAEPNTFQVMTNPGSLKGRILFTVSNGRISSCAPRVS